MKIMTYSYTNELQKSDFTNTYVLFLKLLININTMEHTVHHLSTII